MLIGTFLDELATDGVQVSPKIGEILGEAAREALVHLRGRLGESSHTSLDEQLELDHYFAVMFDFLQTFD